jgi:hypothetical protein
MMMLVAGSVFSQTATPGSRESAERLLQVLKVGENFDNAIRQAVTMQMGLLDKRTDIPAEKKEAVRKSIEPAINSILEKMSWQKMKEMFIDIYAVVFTKEELDGVIAFYESPAGQKFITKQPELTRVTMQKMQALMSEMMPEIQKNTEKAMEQVKAEMEAKPTAGK